MKSTHADTLTQIQSVTPVVRGAVLFDLPSGQWGFWDGTGPLTWNGLTFEANGQLMEIDFGDETTGLESNSFTITLRENTEAGLTPSVLNTIFAEQYHLRPVTVYQAWFNPDTRALAGDLVIFRRGVISTVEKGGGSEGQYIRGTCETQSIKHTRRGWAKASDAEHRNVFADDKFFEYTGIVGTVQQPFGRKLDGTAQYNPFKEKPLL